MQYNWVWVVLCVLGTAVPADSIGRRIDTLHAFSDTSSHGMVQSSQYARPQQSPKAGTWDFEPIVIDEHPPQPRRITDVAAVDIDLDIAWGCEWYENPGDPCAGPWTKHIIDDDWTHETQVEIADLDKDGRLDVALSGEETDDGLAWFHNPGNKSSGPWPRHQVLSGWKGLHSLELGDFDKDGDLDFLVAQMHSTKAKRVAIVENIDLAQDRYRVHVIDTCGSHKAIVCDVDHDGDLDIVGKNFEGDTRLRIWLNPNSPIQTEPQTTRYQRVIRPAKRPQRAKQPVRTGSLRPPTAGSGDSDASLVRAHIRRGSLWQR
jgi:FG-GAP-like repeat